MDFFRHIMNYYFFFKVWCTAFTNYPKSGNCSASVFNNRLHYNPSGKYWLVHKKLKYLWIEHRFCGFFTFSVSTWQTSLNFDQNYVFIDTFWEFWVANYTEVI